MQAKTSEDDRSLAGQIARALADRIVSGQLAPGTALRQDHLATEFGASHVPVREAFRRLEAQGLAVSEPRRGVRVSPLNPSSIIEISEMRAALEALALRYAMPNLTADHLTKAQSAIARDDASDGSDLLTLEQVNREFHTAIIQSCGMPRLLDTIDQLQHASTRILIAMWKILPSWQLHSSNEHRLILDDIAAGRVDVSCERLRLHIVNAGKTLAERLATPPAL